MIKTIEKPCETCHQLFLAEGEIMPDGECGFSPICYECDEKLHKDVDDILKKRGWL